MGRFHLGEGITKKESDLAADVQEQQQALQAKAAERKDQPAAAAAAAPDAAEPQQPAVKVPISHSLRLCRVLNTSVGCTANSCNYPWSGGNKSLESCYL